MTFGEVTRKCCLPVIREDEVSHCATTVEKQKKKGVDEAKGRFTGAVLNKELKNEHKIDDKDFTAVFDGKKWEVEWKGEERVLKN